MKFTESQIQSLAPDDASLKAGKGLSSKNQWLTSGYSDRALWGEIKGSGSKPYQTQADTSSLAFKCSCPSRKFPCKHGIGLMLLWANDASAILASEEPSWVAEWMDKRVAKAEKPTEVKELTEEDVIKAEKSKQKRADDRISSVQAGVDEINLWMGDLVRTGILQLQNKEYNYFTKTAARMVDAKAGGLASWVKSLAKINYTAESHIWQNDALTILSKMNLITSAFSNMDQLSEPWQHSIKNLMGWSQSPKELLADETTPIIKDTWIVIGQETTTEEDIIVQRSWLYGIQTKNTALILNFGTRFAPLDISVINGSIMEAGLVYFPSVWPQRAVVKLQHKLLNEVPPIEQIMPDFDVLYASISNIVATYPFATDIVSVVSKVRPILVNDIYKAVDSTGYLMELSPDFSLDKMINWLAMSGGEPYDLAAIIRSHTLIPMGLFIDNKYVLI